MTEQLARAVTITRVTPVDHYYHAAIARYVEPNTPEKWDMRTIVSECSHRHPTPRQARTCRQKLSTKGTYSYDEKAR